jgi:flagellar basal-body rod protein FlgF
MYTGLYTAVAGGMAQEKRLNVLTNNLANATTAGFKTDQAIFQVLPQTIVVATGDLPGIESPVVMPIDPLATKQTPRPLQLTMHTDFSQGTLRDTGNPLDLALEGPGFFVVDGAGETFYTRQGTFSLNAEGLLVTPQGQLVQGQQGPIQIRGQQVKIDQTGQVLVDGKLVDRLKLVDIPQTAALEKAGESLFRPRTPDVEIQDTTGVVVRQGAIELSNSQLVRLMGSVIQTSRAYEAYQKVMQIFDETAGRAVNDIANTR